MKIVDDEIGKTITDAAEVQRVKHLNELHGVDAETMKMIKTENKRKRGEYNEN